MLADGGHQSVLCSVPFRFDSYLGCSHGCGYCFATVASKKYSSREEFFRSIGNGNIGRLENFLKNNKGLDEYLAGCPIHWGGMSDGFQSIELERGVSLKCLELFAASKYPVIISTKGTTIISSDRYLNVLKDCNAVVQVSMTDRSLAYDKGAPSYESRIDSISKLVDAGVKVIIRNQPYFMHMHDSIIKMVDDLTGVYGFISEGYKGRKCFDKKNMVLTYNEYKYKLHTLMDRFKEIKGKCHESGIKFFSGENRLRWIGDSVNCCGVGEIEGFGGGNMLNASALLFNKVITFSDMPKLKGHVKDCGVAQDTVSCRVYADLNKDGYGHYNYMRYYINHGHFSTEFELAATGLDENGNYKFRFKDKRVELERLKTLGFC